MRIRAVLTAAAATLLLAGCGVQSGPTDQEPPSDAPRPEALRVELDAQMQDPCFRQPAELAPADCRKYITQLASTPEAVRKIDGRGPDLRDAAKTLSNGIGAYRGNGCANIRQDKEECTQALSTVAEALRALRQALETGTG